MSDIRIRVASRTDLPRITEIYNHYVVHTPVTFDVEPQSVERRAAWFDQFSESGRYRLLVADEGPVVVGYAGTTRFRPKAAYDTAPQERKVEALARACTQLYLRQSPPRIFIASWRDTSCRIPLQQRFMNVSVSSLLGYSARTDAN
jgi:phosphinothricin acetyltransferase